MKLVTPAAAQTIIQLKHPIQLIDVRETYEFQYGNNGFLNIPMAEIAEKVATLDNKLPIILICKSGKRAEAVAIFLEKCFGFTDVSVIEGGIIAWKELIDPTIQLD
jgi:rhodanese-related sulfurtransferase